MMRLTPGTAPSPELLHQLRRLSKASPQEKMAFLVQHQQRQKQRQQQQVPRAATKTSPQRSPAASPAGSVSSQERGVKRRLEQTGQFASKNPVDVVNKLSTDCPIEIKFIKPTEEMIQGYTVEVCRAARSGDLEELKRIHTAGNTLQCCNRFGESLIHMVSRRGDLEVVKFFLDEADVSLRVRDDYGRTPLHDACWTPKPRLELVKYILEKEPGLLYVKDVRGHLALNYVRKVDYEVWYDFLEENKDIFAKGSNPATRT